MTSSFPETSRAEVINSIIAQVGEKIITLHDIEAFAPQTVRSIYAMTDQAERETAWASYYEQTVNFMVNDTQIEVTAARYGINATEKEIQDSVTLLQEQNAEFRERVRTVLARERVTTPEITLLAKQAVIKSKVNSILSSRAIVADDEIEDYLEENLSFRLGDAEYNIQLVFLPDMNTFNEVKNNAMNHTFSTAVAASGKPTVDMGWVRQADLVPEIQVAVAPMQPGEMSDAIVNDDGSVIFFQLSDVRTVTSIPDNIRNEAVYALKERQMDAIFDNWLRRNSQSIVVYRYDKQ